MLAWFAQHARDLPWRRTLDPYAIWVSEIMLQQTQVKTVIPYWERWMHELPTAQALAAAKPDKVLKLWEGLGYYTRARNLQRAAQQIVTQHSGRFPTTFDDVLALPGIGRYTAGAITSIALNQPAPILDGNVIRVLTRLFGITEDPREKKTNAHLWSLAAQLVQAARSLSNSKLETRNPKLLLSGPCSTLNQSLMELGALICTPRQPRCKECPLRRPCVARRTHQVDVIPNLAKRAPATARHFLAFVIERDGRWLVRQRPSGVVNASLWEFPNTEVNGAGSDLSRVADSLFGVKLDGLKPLAIVKHSITRYRILLEAFQATWRKAASARSRDARWLTLSQLDHLVFTSAHRKLLEALRRSNDSSLRAPSSHLKMTPSRSR